MFDFWEAFMFCLVIFIIMSCCGYCCTTKKRGAILSTPVIVTSTTHTAPGGFTTTQIPPAAAGGYQTNVYATTYPPQVGTAVQMPMPMPMGMTNAQPPVPGMHPYVAPYPPQQAMAAAHMNPPSYDMAVAGTGAGQPNNSAGYDKQPAYNPSYPRQ